MALGTTVLEVWVLPSCSPHMVQVHTASPRVISQSTCDLSQAVCSKFPLAVIDLSYKDTLLPGPVKYTGSFGGKSVVK